MDRRDVGRGNTVLVVEDEVWLRRIFERILSEDGYSVISAPNGAAALSIAASLHPRFILLDILMPGMDGLAVLRELRIRGERGIVIMVTGRATVASARQAMLLGADEYITKPFSIELLKSVLRELRREDAPEKSACAS